MNQRAASYYYENKILNILHTFNNTCTNTHFNALYKRKRTLGLFAQKISNKYDTSLYKRNRIESYLGSCFLGNKFFLYNLIYFTMSRTYNFIYIPYKDFQISYIVCLWYSIYNWDLCQQSRSKSRSESLRKKCKKKYDYRNL